MEFKFRAVDNKPQSNLADSIGFSYFADQAMRDGLPINIPRKPDVMENPREFQHPGEVQREMEKERIREEIIAAEVARRRVLEEEVRREMAMEREMSIRRAAEMRLSFEDRRTMLFDPWLPSGYPYENGWLDKWMASRAARRAGGFDMLLPWPMPRLLGAMETDSAEVKTPPVSNKDKLIMLARPNPNLTGGKRKAEAMLTVGDDDLPLLVPKKNPKEEWSCALCKVSVTSERTLNEHLRGKKHKAKEAGLRALKVENSNGVSLPKRTQKVSGYTESTGDTESRLKTKIEEKRLQIDKTGKGSDLKEEEDSKKKNDELPSEKQARNEKKSKEAAERAGRKTPESRGKFKYWCEVCLVGTYSEVVMEDHKKGKKHATLLRELSLNGVAIKTHTATDNVARVKYQPGEDEKQKTTEIADGGGSTDIHR